MSVLIGVPLVAGCGKMVGPTSTEFPLPPPHESDLLGITTEPDGDLWFTEPYGPKIGRITPAGHISEFPLPTSNESPESITAGPDGKLWFTDPFTQAIGRLTLAR